MVACKLHLINNSTIMLHNPCLFMIIIIFWLFLMTTPPYVTPLNFSFPNITNDDEQSIAQIHTDQKAFITQNGIQLAENQTWTVGRAFYFKPLHLWNNVSQNLTDFTTHFSFVIDSQDKPMYTYGNGITFFLLPSNISNVDSSFAWGIGLPINNMTMTNTSPFVAVEFDTFRNDWDPLLPSLSFDVSHVGININSMTSVNTSIWYSNTAKGSEHEAWISYNSVSKVLDVSFTGYYDNNTRFIHNNISYVVDLRKYLPELVTIGFSASTGKYFETNTIKSWEFSSSYQIDATIRQRFKRIGLVVGLSVGLCVLVGGLGLVGLWVWKRSRGPEEEDHLVIDLSDEFEKGIGPKKFSYRELEQATNNFSEGEKLGMGGFGWVYRGFLRELNSHVAVKRVSRDSKQGIKEFSSEVKIISQLRHRNLVKLIGWCHEKRELIIVYELMPNGSLDLHLFKGKSMLTWAMRYTIVQGLASALLYLHEECEQYVLHRDIKSSNIMLDNNFNAKLGDFGLARLVDHEKELQTTVLAGTIAYMAPECRRNKRKASKQSDVYSFGIVALEIASGRKPHAQETEIVEWIWDLYGTERHLEAADSKLCKDFDEQKMGCLIIVGLWCAHPDNSHRPSIKEAIQVLNFEAPLPNLSLKMPSPTYNDPPVVNPLLPSNNESGSNQIQSSVLVGR